MVTLSAPLGRVCPRKLGASHNSNKTSLAPGGEVPRIAHRKLDVAAVGLLRLLLMLSCSILIPLAVDTHDQEGR